MNNVLGTYDVTRINDNFQKIQEELNEKVLYRKNPNGTSNQIKSDIDMNSHRLLNLPAPASDNEAARLKDVTNAVAGLAATTANTVRFDPIPRNPATNLQGAIVNVDAQIEGLKGRVVNVLDFGADRYGNADSASAIQEAIDYAATLASSSYPRRGVVVTFPAGNYRANQPIILKDGVMLKADGSLRSGTASITGYGNYVVTTPDVTISSAGVDGVSLFGGNSGVLNALRIVSANDCRFANFSTNNTQDQGVVSLAGVANSYSNLLIVNAVLNRVRNAPIGGFELHCFDPIVTSVEASGHAGGTSNVSSAACHISAILAASTQGFYSQCIGEFGDVGIRVTGSNNRFTNCRADTTMGHGVVNTGGQNSFSALEVLNPAMGSASDTYDAVQNNSTNSVFSGVTIQKTSGSRGRYAINLSAYSEVNVRSTLIGVIVNQGSPGFLSKYNVSLDSDAVASLALASAGYITDRSTSPTIDLSRSKNIRLFPSAPTSYTGVSGAVPGEIYSFVLNDASTLSHSSNKITTKDGASITGASFSGDWKIVQFFAYSPTWIREIGR